MQDLSMEMHRNERGRVCLCTLIDCKRKHLTTRFCRASDQVPNVRHFRVMYTFSSVTSSAFLIQQDVEVVDEFRQHDGVVTVMVK